MPVLLGDYLILTCSFSNSSNSTNYPIRWFHNDVIRPMITTSTYTISGIQVDDLGYYKCGNTVDSLQLEKFNVYTKGKNDFNIGILNSNIGRAGII